MRKKFLLCIFINCVVYFILANSNLFTMLYKKIHPTFVLDITSTIIISALFSFICKGNIKEKFIDFIKVCIMSYFCIIAIIFVCFMYVMGRFD